MRYPWWPQGVHHETWSLVSFDKDMAQDGTSQHTVISPEHSFEMHWAGNHTQIGALEKRTNCGQQVGPRKTPGPKYAAPTII